MCNIVTKRFISCHDELKEKGIIRSSRQFALNLDYLPQSLNEILKGNREVTVDLLRKAIEVYQINPDYLFLGTGGKFKNADFDQGTDNIVHNRNTIKYVPVSAQAGYVDQFHEIVFENELKSFVDELLISTDDGSYGHKGLVTELLRNRLETDKDVFEVVAVGPVPMMAAVAETTRPFGVKTTVSLNPIMVDGIGMCGACRVTVGGKTKFACVDGPEFDGHEVDFPELRRRLAAYREQETVSIEEYRRVSHGE